MCLFSVVLLCLGGSSAWESSDCGDVRGKCVFFSGPRCHESEDFEGRGEQDGRGDGRSWGESRGRTLMLEMLFETIGRSGLIAVRFDILEDGVLHNFFCNFW